MSTKMRCSDKVCLLKKALYGLRKSARSCHTRIGEDIHKFRTTLIDTDQRVYRMHHGRSTHSIAMYVDDIITSCEHSRIIEKFSQFLSGNFEIKYRGEADYCIGMEFHRNSDGITMHHQSYILYTLSHFVMLD